MNRRTVPAHPSPVKPPSTRDATTTHGTTQNGEAAPDAPPLLPLVERSCRTAAHSCAAVSAAAFDVGLDLVPMPACLAPLLGRAPLSLFHHAVTAGVVASV